MGMVWWAALKKSLNCKSQGSCEVIKRDDSRGSSARGLIKKSFLLPSSSLRRSGCSRSISNLRDVVHGQCGGSSRRHAPAGVPSGCASPRSIGSSDVVNAVTHDVLLAAGGAGSGRELRIGAGTPGRGAWAGGGMPFANSPLLMRSSTGRLSQRKSPRTMSPLHRESGACDGDVGSPVLARASCELIGIRCQRCGGRFANNDSLESHHLANHAVTELVDGETPRKVVELIYKAGWPKPEVALDRIERVVKVHNVERWAQRFTEYREEVKSRAAALAKKHPRCIADGNELLQFHATTVSCSLGAGGSPGLCTSSRCNVCSIIRHGFSATRESRGGGNGVFTASTSKRALECLQLQEACAGAGEAVTAGGVRQALIVCRVIAGRIHRPLENPQDVAAQPGFDSVARRVGADASIEELYLLNPSAFLPCFVVICKS